MTDMTKPFDGGPAFPVHGGHHPDDDPRNHTLGGGMTLRDWFAGQAIRVRWGDGTAMTAAQAADMAYQLADAMLAAREGIA